MEFADLLERLAMLGPIPRDIFEADKWDLEKLEREYRGLNLEFAAALNMISPRSNYSGTLVHLLVSGVWPSSSCVWLFGLCFTKTLFQGPAMLVAAMYHELCISKVNVCLGWGNDGSVSP